MLGRKKWNLGGIGWYLSREMTVKEFMTRPVVTVTSTNKVKRVKEILRIKKISGMPVVDEGGQLVGIISVDDIIQALEMGQMDSTVDQWMSCPVHCLQVDESILDAIEKFNLHHVGRFPILDAHNRVVGILTPGDVLAGFFDVFENLHGDKVPTLNQSNLTEQNYLQDVQQVMKVEYHIKGGDFGAAGEASSGIKRLLQQAGFAPDIIRRVAIAAYEAEMNVVIHAYEGDITVYIRPEEIEIIVEDRGPGIADIDLAMQEGYSTAPDQIREMGFGAGMGLPNIYKCVDQFTIQSTLEQGTVLTIKVKP